MQPSAFALRGLPLLYLVALSLVMFLLSALVISLLPVGLRGSFYVEQAIIQLLTFALPPCTLSLWLSRRGGRSLLGSADCRLGWVSLALWVVSLLLLQPLVEVVGEWNNSINLGRWEASLRAVQHQSESLTHTHLYQPSLGSLLKNLLCMALIPALCEELYFRVGIQGILSRGSHHPHVVIILTAVVFSLAHGEAYSFAPRFLLGVLLGYAFATGGIKASAVLHFTNNALVVVVSHLLARGVQSFAPEQPFSEGQPFAFEHPFSEGMPFAFEQPFAVSLPVSLILGVVGIALAVVLVAKSDGKERP
ncbi:MAG: CPBP family intramembrane metalloprotease [Bacteroidales bacterium]|nr:CPBP family intramembrane metalloprotease [Bacteroidales bacterium]